jgi:hypothetical protein
MSSIFLNFLIYTVKVLINKLVANCWVAELEDLGEPDKEKKCAKKCAGRREFFHTEIREQRSGTVNRELGSERDVDGGQTGRRVVAVYRHFEIAWDHHGITPRAVPAPREPVIFIA